MHTLLAITMLEYLDYNLVLNVIIAIELGVIIYALWNKLYK